MKKQDGMFKLCLLTSSILLILLLAGCAQSPETCPSSTPVGLANANEIASDDSLPFRFPLAVTSILSANFTPPRTTNAQRGHQFMRWRTGRLVFQVRWVDMDG